MNDFNFDVTDLTIISLCIRKRYEKSDSPALVTAAIKIMGTLIAQTRVLDKQIADELIPDLRVLERRLVELPDLT